MLAALLAGLGLAGGYLETGIEGMAALAVSPWNITLFLLIALPGLALLLTGVLLSAKRPRKPVTRKKPDIPERPLSPPEAMQIVQAFGDHLRKYSSRRSQFLDVSVLPYPKVRIEQAIFALLVNANAKEKSALCDGLVLLAFYQEGVDRQEGGADVDQLAAAYDRLKFANDDTLDKLAAKLTPANGNRRCAKQLKDLRDADIARYEKIWEATVYPRSPRGQEPVSHAAR